MNKDLLKEFIPCGLAKQLKKLKFNENCLGVYDDVNEFYFFSSDALKMTEIDERLILAPLWQQAFDWFRIKHGLHVDIRTTVRWGKREHTPYIHINGTDYPLCGEMGGQISFEDYDEAKLATLRRIINTVEISV